MDVVAFALAFLFPRFQSYETGGFAWGLYFPVHTFVSFHTLALGLVLITVIVCYIKISLLCKKRGEQVSKSLSHMFWERQVT